MDSRETFFFYLGQVLLRGQELYVVCCGVSKTGVLTPRFLYVYEMRSDPSGTCKIRLLNDKGKESSFLCLRF